MASDGERVADEVDERMGDDVGEGVADEVDEGEAAAEGDEPVDGAGGSVEDSALEVLVGLGQARASEVDALEDQYRLLKAQQARWIVFFFHHGRLCYGA